MSRSYVWFLTHWSIDTLMAKKQRIQLLTLKKGEISALTHTPQGSKSWETRSCDSAQWIIHQHTFYSIWMSAIVQSTRLVAMWLTPIDTPDTAKGALNKGPYLKYERWQYQNVPWKKNYCTLQAQWYVWQSNAKNFQSGNISGITFAQSQFQLV